MQQETSAFHLMIRSLRAEVVDIDMEYILHTSLGAVRIQQIQTNSLTDFVIVKCSDEEGQEKVYSFHEAVISAFPIEVRKKKTAIDRTIGFKPSAPGIDDLTENG
jgi:hypothetical protein